MRALSSRDMLAYAFVCSAGLHGQSYAFAPGGCAHFFASSRSPPSWQHKRLTNEIVSWTNAPPHFWNAEPMNPHRHARIVLITTPPPALALLVFCTRESGSREALDEGRDQLWGDTAPREAVLKRLEQARWTVSCHSALTCNPPLCLTCCPAAFGFRLASLTLSFFGLPATHDCGGAYTAGRPRGQGVQRKKTCKSF